MNRHIILVLLSAVCFSRSSFALDENHEWSPEVEATSVEQSDSPLMMLRYRSSYPEREGTGGTKNEERDPLIGHHSTEDKTEQNRRSHSATDRRDLEANRNQGPSPDEVKGALEVLLSPDRIFNSATHLLDRLPRSQQTMACLRCLNVMGDDFTIMSLQVANQGSNFGTYFLIFNDGAVPFTFTIPSDDGSSNPITIEAPIIPSGMKSNIPEVARSPIRNASPQENEQVKDYIYEAFEDYFGTETAAYCLNYLMKEGEKQQPLTIEKLQQAFANLVEFYEKPGNLSGPYVKQQVQRLEIKSIDLSHVSDFLDAKKREKLSAYAQAEKGFSNSKKILSDALWSSAESLARGAGVAGGMVAGAIAPAALLNAAVGTHYAGPASIIFMLLCSRYIERQIDASFNHGEPAGSAGLVGTVAGAIMSVTVPTIGTQCISLAPFTSAFAAKKTWSYLAPDVPAREAWNKLHQWNNTSEFARQSVSQLQELSKKEQELPGKLANFLDNSSSEIQKNLLPYFAEQMNHDEAPTFNFDRVKEFLATSIEKRIEAFNILINDLEEKINAL